jgi:UTP--glucose-1-phosphate uridylyltransferase
MEDYFDNNLELEYSLEENGKLKALEVIREIPQMANFIYVRQKKHLPYGNATPLLAAKDLIDDDEVFVYMFGDDLTFSEKPVTAQLIEVFEQQGAAAVIGVQEVPDRDIERYGTVKYKNKASYKYEIEGMYEKLPAGKAPSNMAQFGRFVFSYDVVKELQQTKTGKDNELWLTDVLNGLAQHGKKVIAQPIEGRWLTTGDPLNYLKATITFALDRPRLKDELRLFLRNLEKDHS